MGTWATGKYAQRISDRSGMAFPYNEMVQEWTGAWVHVSEYTPKQPQLNPPYHRADAVALQHPKPQEKSGIIVSLSPSLLFSTGTEGSMFPPETANQANKKRQATLSVGKVTITIT